MNPKTNVIAARNFPSALEEAAAVAPTPLYDGPDSSYRLAFTDEAFLLREELRPVRMQLELLKPELVLSEAGIVATVVIFGSARLLPPDVLLAGWPEISLPDDEAGRFLTGLRRRVLLADAPAVRVYRIGPGGPGGPGGHVDLGDPGGHVRLPVDAHSRAFLGSAHITAGELIADRLLSPLEVQALIA